MVDMDGMEQPLMEAEQVKIQLLKNLAIPVPRHIRAAVVLVAGHTHGKEPVALVAHGVAALADIPTVETERQEPRIPVAAVAEAHLLPLQAMDLVQPVDQAFLSSETIGKENTHG